MNGFVDWLLARLSEPSTYAGIAGVVASMSFLPNASTYAQDVIMAGTAIASVLAIVLPEVKASKTNVGGK